MSVCACVCVSVCACVLVSKKNYNFSLLFLFIYFEFFPPFLFVISYLFIVQRLSVSLSIVESGSPASVYIISCMLQPITTIKHQLYPSLDRRLLKHTNNLPALLKCLHAHVYICTYTYTYVLLS